LGYIDGGTEALVKALVGAIEARGGRIVLSAPATRITCSAKRVTGVAADAAIYPADAVIATVPTPLVARLVPDLPDEERKAYDAIASIGVVCAVFRLKRSVSPYFWINISDRRFAIPGIVEFSNLRPTGDTVVYVPYYMPTTNPKFARDDAFFRDEAFGYLRLINTALTDDDLIAVHVGRLRHAQPVCPPGFAAMLPPIETSISGLQIADTCFYYPEDRGISESVRLGKLMAERIK
jgi:protoporphyrinogen oxidase